MKDNKFVLLETIEREISNPEFFATYEDAFARMKAYFEEARRNDDNGELSEWSAYCENLNHDNCDWAIFPVARCEGAHLLGVTETETECSMEEEDLSYAVYDKVVAEQASYREWLLSLKPEEILYHAYEYSVREDIVMAMEDAELSAEQAKAMLACPAPLAECFQEFCKVETDHMQIIRDCIDSRAKSMEERYG